MSKERHLGQIVWTDLTIPDAKALQEFYAAVIGWDFEATNMGDYDDYTALADSSRPAPGDQGKVIAGLCHARGENADMPAQWLNYISVDNLDTSLNACLEHGGQQISKVKTYGQDRYCAIADPAGAVFGIFEICPD